MKTITSLFIATIFLLPFSGRSQEKKQTGPQATNEPTVFKGVLDNNCSVEVGFGSPGSGIDAKAFEKVMTAIDSRKLKYTSKSTGREGETRLCLPLTELKAKKKKQFINQLKKIAKEGQYVSVSIR